MSEQLPPSTSHLPEVHWYYLEDGVQVGPISEQRLIQAAKLGRIRPETLVWHAALEAWKQAAVIPMLAVNLEQTERRNAFIPEPSAPTQPELANEAIEASMPLPELQDAVSDEEAEEQVVDANQVRELLVRTSRFPPERSIPPASSASMSTPLPALPVAFTWTRAATAVGVSLLGLSVVLFALHWRNQRVNVATARVEALALRAPQAATHAVPDQRETRRIGGEGSRPSAAKLSKPAPEARPSILTATSASPLPTAVRAVKESSEASDIAGAPPVLITDGPLTAEPFATQLQRSLPVFDQQCWDRLHSPYGSPSPKPSVRITMSVDRTGHVYDITSSKAPAGYRGAGLCIIGRMRGWKFPQTEANTHATIIVTRSHG